MYIYQSKNNFIYKLHHITMLSYIVTVFLLALLYSHPLFLLALFFSVGAVGVSSGITQEWLSYLKTSKVFIFLIILINGLFVRVGSTALFTGPCLPVFGKIRITLEALCYGAGMGLRFLVMISAFCLFNFTVNPDKITLLLGKWGSKSSLALCLALRLFPLMKGDLVRIKEAQQARGVNWQERRFWSRLRQYMPVIEIMLLSSLERSFQLAESMQARGYGGGNRTVYTADLWRPRDYLLLVMLLTGLFLTVCCLFSGYGIYAYYPRLQAIHRVDFALASLLVPVFSFPAVLNWGWKKWPVLKSKI